ncbi:MAG: thioredoxin-like domain-containing protein [Rikenellaceae bacterium]
MRKITLIAIITVVCVLCGCSGKNGSAKIKGEFSGMKQVNIVVEEIVPGRIMFLDSVKTNNRGRFSFKYRFRDENPVFIRLRYEDDYLTLLASPGEKIVVNTIINLSRNYSVSGSEGSQLVRDLNVGALNTCYKMDSLYPAYLSSTLSEERRKLEVEFTELYVQQKRNSIEFLIRNSKSMASLMALYQTLPTGLEVFGEKNDFRYFAMIADSLSVAYPTSPHVKSLMKSVENRTRAIERTQSFNVSESLPPIDLPDIYGAEHSLASLVNDKTILLTFWSATDPSSAMLNKELKELYTGMKDHGFEIYQVSLDEDKNIWVSAIVEQNIPWISVRDEAGGSRSVAARTYQINSLPANYLIDRNGNIVGKNLWGSNLTKKVEEITQ